MANSLGTNPITVDTTDTTLWSDTKYVKEVKWLDDAGDIAADDILIITVNGATITRKVIAGALIESGYQVFGPFDKGVPWSDVGITVPHGLVTIWLE